MFLIVSWRLQRDYLHGSAFWHDITHASTQIN